jgi:hypothetical protein
MKTNYESCNKSLQTNSLEAFICKYECTFCIDCVKNILRKMSKLWWGF